VTKGRRSAAPVACHSLVDNLAGPRERSVVSLLRRYELASMQRALRSSLGSIGRVM